MDVTYDRYGRVRFDDDVAKVEDVLIVLNRAINVDHGCQSRCRCGDICKSEIALEAALEVLRMGKSSGNSAIRCENTEKGIQE